MKRFVYENVACRRRRLPHWDVPGGIYFVTFCLEDAIPRAMLMRLLTARDEALIEANRTRSPMRESLIAEAQRRFQLAVNDLGDEGYDSSILRNPSCADVVAGALRFFDGTRYELMSWCVMPSHVHVIFRLRDGTLDGVMHSWKRHTSRVINTLTGRSGQLWQEEYFDVTIRDTGHLRSTVGYVLANPGKAGLEPWAWKGFSAEALSEMGS